MLDVLSGSGEQRTCPVERRKWQRLPIAVPVFVRGIDAQGKAFIEFTSALNISAGGMLVAARRFLPSLTGLSLEIPTVPLSANLMAGTTRLFKVKVVREVIANHCQYVAFKFTRPLISKVNCRQARQSE
ncbi:MAG TPA: PilZ domain-containing protein [Terriglobales bacterium]|nr:PilZ domain-containing protein [Terriglobales bacterium]